MPTDNSKRIPRRLDADAFDEALEMYRQLRKICPKVDDIDIAFTIARSFSWGLAQTAALLSFLAAMGEPATDHVEGGVEN
jgi:hypothetical protein